MNTHPPLRTLTASFLVLTLAAPSFSVEILKNGGLDESVGPAGWISSETITGQPGASISLAEHISFANSPNDTGDNPLGVFVKPRSGNIDAFEGQNLQINYMLMQTVGNQTGAAGQTYTFTGDARLTAGYSGAVEFLDPLSPGDPLMTGTVPSPTQTKLTMTFLDASSQPIGAPASLELRSPSLLVDEWQTHTLSAVAPAGTTQVKVAVAATDIVDNFGGQDLFFDNFKLTRGTQTINRLTNGNLNAPGAPSNWTLTETPPTADNASFIGFAHHPTPETPTGQGLWVRAFEGGDAHLQQTQAAVSGGNYSFKGWSLFEENFEGGITGQTTVSTFFQIEFLDAANAVLGTPARLNVFADRLSQSGAEMNANDSMWRQHTLDAQAPAGAVNLRVTVGATGMSIMTGPKLSAFFDDFSLQLAGPAGDFDGNGRVDGNDFLVWQRGGSPAPLSAADLATWKANFGTGGAAGVVAAVPEPATFASGLVLALVAAAWRRRAA